MVRQLPLIGLGPISDETRCGPCHAIAPTFETLSKKYSNVNFFKCDVDAAAEVARVYSISAMCVLCIVLILNFI